MNLYTLQDNSFVVENGGGGKYILKIRDLPTEERPREKLVAHGPAVLQLSELLAIVMSVGSRKEEVLSMSNRILREYGEKALLSQTDPKKIAETLDIPLVKACQVVSCLEIGRRLFQNPGRRSTSIRTAKEAYEFVKDMRDLQKEYLRGLYLNSHYRLVHDEVISIGSINASIIHPREVFRPAVEYAASAVILVHNHPSGVVKPSEEDVAITRQLLEAGAMLGIDLLDHIIVTRRAFLSITEKYL